MILKIGENIRIDAFRHVDVKIIDAKGAWVTPGIVDMVSASFRIR